MKNLMLTQFILLAALLVGCAKERKFDEVYKEEVFLKSAFSEDTNDPYLYLPTVGETPMMVSSSRPFAFGSEKLVRFRFEKEKLIVEELPEFSENQANGNNFSPVLSFDIEHKDYRCKEDQFGSCANAEEEVDDRPIDQKRYAQIDLTSLDVQETNTLPEQLTNLFIGCYGKGDLTVKKFKMEDGAINIHVQRTWKANILCADLGEFTVRDLSNAAFSVDYYYSFVKLSKIASPDYKTRIYPFEDESTFGYFARDMKKKTADGRETVNSDYKVMNRWNPSRKEIVYYLNEPFYRSGMEAILLSTHQAVDTINASFQKAGVDMKIVLKDGRDKDIGDLRNSFIVMVADELAAGLLGYGPTAVNPKTGEILKGQTVMYHGTIKKFIQETYDELVEEKAREEENRTNAEVAANVRHDHGTAVSEDDSLRNQAHNSLMSQMTRSTARPVQTARVNQVRVSAESFKAIRSEKMNKTGFDARNQVNLKFWLAQLKNSANLSQEEIARATVNEMSHRCFYHESFVNWNASLAPEVRADNLELDELKTWNDLTEAEQKKVIAKLMPTVWVPTLVHELGHNLGLRHNFNGSEDKDNFYTAQERSAMGLTREIVYSSVMDYSQNTLNQLPVMGKYDIAALRFGYNNEVEKKDGSVYKLQAGETLESLKKESRSADFKEFQFCTDDHVEVNPGCNRFDEGTNLKEIAQNFVDEYNKNYTKRNFRNLRKRFNTHSGDVNHYFRTDYTFSSVRRFFEVFDRISNMYPGVMDLNWDEEIANAPDEATREIMRSNREFFDGVKGAAQVAADFYLDVLTTPDVHCVIVNSQTQRLQGITPITDFDERREAKSCFDSKIRLRAPFVVVGQTGKFFDNRRFRDELPGELVARPDEISIRGIWIDKVQAVNYLTKRVLGISSFDDYRSNFLDYPVFGDKIRAALAGFMNGTIEREANIQMADGSSLKIPHTFDLGTTHRFNRSLSSGLNRFFGITKVETDFRELLIPMVKKSLVNADNRRANLGFYNSMSLEEVSPLRVLNESQIAKSAVFLDDKGLEIGRFAATTGNTIAIGYMKQREQRAVLDKFTREQLVPVYLARAQNQVPEVIPEELKVVYEMDLDFLLGYLQGVVPDDSTILDLFWILSQK
jgi:hypothetical protein